MCIKQGHGLKGDFLGRSEKQSAIQSSRSVFSMSHTQSSSKSPIWAPPPTHPLISPRWQLPPAYLRTLRGGKLQAVCHMTEPHQKSTRAFIRKRLYRESEGWGIWEGIYAGRLYLSGVPASGKKKAEIYHNQDCNHCLAPNPHASLFSTLGSLLAFRHYTAPSPCHLAGCTCQYSGKYLVSPRSYGRTSLHNPSTCAAWLHKALYARTKGPL